MTSGTTLRNVHGVTSTLWYLALVVQPWLVTNGYVRWHRRVAVAVITLLPILVVTALMSTRQMLTQSALPAAALLGFPPALTRFVGRTFGINPFVAINISFFVVELVLLTLMVVDWRMGERRRRAYPIALVTHVAVQLFMTTIPATAWWLAFCRWFGAGAMGG